MSVDFVVDAILAYYIPSARLLVMQSFLVPRVAPNPETRTKLYNICASSWVAMQSNIYAISRVEKPMRAMICTTVPQDRSAALP